MKRKIKFYFGIPVLLLLILPGRQGVANPVVVGRASVTTYEELVSAIRMAKAESKERVEAIVEQEKVREAWEIGKLIDEHVLQHKERADYGKQVLERLAKDLDTSQTELSFMLQFARAYPIHWPANKLSWSHYEALLSLNDPNEREDVSKQAEKENWTRDRLREEVRKRQAAGKAGEGKGDSGIAPTQAVLTAVSSKPGLYRVVKAHYGKKPNQLVLDLGFANYYRPPGKFPFKEGDIVWEDKGRLKKSKGAREEDLFAYRAEVLKVIDGDTLTAAVDLGFGITTVQTLRLRALDAPEIETAEGGRAKEFLAKLLSKSSAILIRTQRSDKYDRYLVDVFADGHYVNQKLVEEGHAVILE